MSRYGPQVADVAPAYPWQGAQRALNDPWPFEPCDEWFMNGYGMYRWHLIRTAYHEGIIDEEFVTKLSVKWRDLTEFMMIDGFTAEDEYSGYSAFVKCSKRGNDVYKKRVRDKFKFFDQLPNVVFFNEEWGRKTSPMLFVTLTVDPSRYTLKEAWESISQEFNRFETLLKQKYGHFVKFRVWESHKNGYPHIHVCYYFLNHWFMLFEHWSEADSASEPKRTWRCSNKVRESIKKMWSMGWNVDIQGVQDTLKAMSEVQKYVTKSIWSEKADKTNAMLTLFRKQSYHISLCDPYNQPLPPEIAAKGFMERDEAVREYLGAMANVWASKDFIGAVWGVDWYLQFYYDLMLKHETLAEPGLSALVNETLHNYNNEVPEITSWRFRGIALGVDLERFYPQIRDEWTFLVKDPPPDVSAVVKMFEVV